MDAGEQLKEDLREGRVNANRLVDLIVSLQRHSELGEQPVQPGPA